MGSYTSAICYRAGGFPPMVLATDLARFTECILALGILDGDQMDIQLKFGKAIDQDDKSTHEEEQVSQFTRLMLEYDWHINEHNLKHADAVALLTHPPTSREVPRKHHILPQLSSAKTQIETFRQHIYRARFYYGMLKEEVYRDICHESESNYLQLTDLSFTIDLVELNDPQESGIFQVGWMEFSVHGNGYLFPWSYESTLEILRHHPALQQVLAICREMWPATPTPPRRDHIANRARMGKLWAEPVDAPFDWYWAINETY